MEELRTSEKLEQEILNDARKKADRILRNAESEIRRVQEEWKAKREEAFDELENRYKKKREDARTEVESSLPLELKRQELAYYDKLVRKYLDEYFSTLSHEDLLSYIRSMMEKVREVFSGREVLLRYGGISLAKIQDLLSEVCPGCSIIRKAEVPEMRGLQLELSDGHAKFTATAAEIEQVLLDEKRQELFSSLFGEAKEQ